VLKWQVGRVVPRWKQLPKAAPVCMSHGMCPMCKAQTHVWGKVWGQGGGGRCWVFKRVIW